MLEKLKLYLRIEPEYKEEDFLLLGFIKEAEEYIYNATGFKADEGNELYNRAVLLYATNAYECRAIQDGRKVAEFSLRHLLMQLRYCYDNES